MQQRGTTPLFVRENPRYFRMAQGNKQSEPLRLAYEDPKTGGRVLLSPQREKEGRRNAIEKAIYEKELSMCKTLAKNGYKVEYLASGGRAEGQTYDIFLNGTPADLKSFRGAGAMVKQIKHALRDQGAQIVVVRLEDDKSELMGALLEARRKIKQGRILYFKGDEGIINELF